MTVTVDPVAFYAAGRTVGRARTHAEDRITSAVWTLNDCAAMAGSDSGGQAWATSYDASTRSVLAVSCDVVTALDHATYLLNQTGANYAAAEHASAPTGSTQSELGAAGNPYSPGYLGRGGASMAVTPPASAAGGSGGGPPGWGLIQSRVGYLWPNGHQDKLHTAAAAWNRASAGLTESRVNGVAGNLAGVRCPELTSILSVSADLDTHVVELAQSYTAMGQACTDYATHLDQAHHDATHELETFVAESIAMSATGVVFTIVSAGASDALAATAIGIRCAAVAARVAAILERLQLATQAISRAIGVVATGIAERGRSIRALLHLRIDTAAVRAVPAIKDVHRAGSLFRRTAEYRAAMRRWPKISGILRDAARHKGDFSVGVGTREEARVAGRAWVGDNAVRASDGLTWVSKDGLREYRPPAWKSRHGKYQANFESRDIPKGEWQNNGHFDLDGAP